MSEEPRDAVPAVGAMWFPDEGGIMFRGKAYLPDDYVLDGRAASLCDDREDFERLEAVVMSFFRKHGEDWPDYDLAQHLYKRGVRVVATDG